MKIVIICSVIAGALLSCGAGAAEPAGLPNADFEKGAENWRLTRATVSAQAARSGTLGLRLLDESTRDASFAESEAIPAKAGRRYQLKFWSRNAADRDGYHGDAFVELVFEDAEGSLLTHEKLKNAIRLKIAAESEWKEFELTGTAPPGSRKCSVMFMTRMAGAVILDIDDISLAEVK